MSFITKRERVFNDDTICDLPARNEGKLKAYASCTDARAWSHFGSSKTEHLTELIKRNNDLSVVKYVPTKVIVDTLMASKNMEVARLKRKIDEFEQMLAIYEELDLDCAQKCEIAKAIAAIKAANKDLDDLCLNLDMSTCTDGFDTESFETGKSRSSVKSKGAEWTVMVEKQTEEQGNQTGLVCPCDVGVSVEDPRIDEMKEQIISKDAKLNAMRNSLAIMENDICEPFGIYAHIYTALEKIFGVLSQNAKFRQYLNLMTAGKDIRCIDIKGKILFKMKVLEKFCLALIAPCSKDFTCTNESNCPCYYADVSTKIDAGYHLAPAECTSSDSTKRSQLVADIMEHEEMKDILSKESTVDENDDSESDKVQDIVATINEENQKRIKDLQECYEDLLNCYENLKHETDCIRIRCSKYEELELELERLRNQLKEYNSLWNEKEHYKKRSEDLDSLKHQYMVLAEESSGLETKLKAESEINNIKANAIDELRDQNVSLEKRLNDLYITFEKEKNNLNCQLQESECKCMCQEQQIKSLNTQIMTLLEQQTENIPRDEMTKENESLKEQLKQYQDIEYEFLDKMSHIKELEAEIEKWRAAYEEILTRNKNLEDYIKEQENEKNKLLNENSILQNEITDKCDAVENLMTVIKAKSVEIHKLTNENQNLSSQIELLGENYQTQLNLSRQESQELLRKVKDYDEFVQKQEDLSNVIEEKMQEYESLKRLLKQKIEENETLKSELGHIKNENEENKKSIELTKQESSTLEKKLSQLEDISQQFMDLKDAFEKLRMEKDGLERDLKKKALQLESAIYSIKLNKKESSELLEQSTGIKDELAKMGLKNDSLQKQLDSLRAENEDLKIQSARLSTLEHKLLDLKKAISELLKEKADLEHSIKIKDEQISNLHDHLENKIDENQSLNDELSSLKSNHLDATKNLKKLQNEKEVHQTELDNYKRESSALIEKLQCHNSLQNELQELKIDHETMKLDKDRLQRQLEAQVLDLKKLQKDNHELQSRTDDLLAHNNHLEKVLINTRNELLSTKSSSPEKTPLSELSKEVQKMREEKLESQKKIREQLHQLDEAEQLIANYEDEMQSRNCKIALMQNQINALENEVRQLQELLEQALNAGTDIKNTNISIEQARQQIEAHHSKASHNMKLELAVLQKSKSKLEDQLFTTKTQYETSFKDKQNFLSENEDLKNDREIIVTDIKQLEVYSVGDSELTLEHCEIECILHSIDRIRKAFETRNAKTMSLEQTLAKVQASSQLTLSKADEAKIYFENEKRKILNDKDNALQENLILEKQLTDLKKELNMQILQDGGIINDLQAEIQNQKLIIDKINESTKKYITSLKDEMQTLKDLYDEALHKIRELQEKLSESTAEKDTKEETIQNLIANLEIKSKEISELKTKYMNLNKEPTNKAAQIPTSDNFRDISTQTDDIPRHTFFDLTGPAYQVSEDEMTKINLERPKDSIHPMHDLLPQQKLPLVNEVQILAAKVEPSFDFVRSSYLNYKLKRLGPGQLEHHSIPSLTPSINSDIEKINNMSDQFPRSVRSYVSHDIGISSSTEDLVDIYRSPSNDIVSSSKVFTVQKQHSVTHGQILHTLQPEKTSDINAEVIRPGNKSDSRLVNKPHSEDYLNISSNISGDKGRKTTNVKFEANTPPQLREKRTDKVKQKLDISLPRVGVENSSLAMNTDNDNNSLDSFAIDLHSHPTKETLSDTTVMIPSSGEYISKSGTPSLPTISISDDIYMQSRSFVVSPSKDLSYKQNSSQAKNGTEAKPESLKHLLLYEDQSRVRSPEDTFIEKHQKLHDKTDDILLVTDIENETTSGKVSKPYLNLDTFITSNDSLDPFLFNTMRKVTGNKLAREVNDGTKSFIDTDKKSKRNTKEQPNQDLLLKRESEKSLNKGRILSKGKSETKNGKVSSDRSIAYSNDQEGGKEMLSHDDLARELDVYLKASKSSSVLYFGDSDNNAQANLSNFGLAYFLDSSKPDLVDDAGKILESTHNNEKYVNEGNHLRKARSKSSNKIGKSRPKSIDQGVMANLDINATYYQEIITSLRKSVQDAEKDHKMQIEAIKVQYDRNIKNIMNEHNQGVMSMQSIHEETLRDIMRAHENEVESLRSMSIEAMRKAQKLERECTSLKSKMSMDGSSLIDEVPTKSECFLEVKNVKDKLQSETKVLTKTTVEAFNVKPKVRSTGPCTCSLGINVSDTIRSIFEQVDVDQRKMAETTYLKYIATKIANGHLDTLDSKELSFLHLKVCRSWKLKLHKEEALQKKIDSLEVELIRKQKTAQQHMAELDRKVAQEKRRLEEVREAVCRSTGVSDVNPLAVRATGENNYSCPCTTGSLAIADRRSAGDLVTAPTVTRSKRKTDHRATVSRADAEERRDRRLYTDEPPTRLRRAHDRPARLTKK